MSTSKLKIEDFSSSANDFLKTFLSEINANSTVEASKHLASAVGEVISNEKAEIARDILAKDIMPAKAKVLNLGSRIKSLGKDAVKFSRESFQKIQEGKKDELLEGLKTTSTEALINGKDLIISKTKSAAESIPEIKTNTVAFVDRITNEYTELQNDDDKARYILKLCLYSAIFSYGFYKGNELPDADFALWGAGAHRSFLSHSVAPFLVASAGLTLLDRVLERAEKHLQNQPSSLKLNKDLRLMISIFGIGLGSGMTVHLAIDGLVQTGGTIRIHDLDGNSFGSIIAGTKIDDMAYTTAMSLFTGKMTSDIHKENI